MQRRRQCSRWVVATLPCMARRPRQPIRLVARLLHGARSLLQVESRQRLGLSKRHLTPLIHWSVCVRFLLQVL